MRHKVLSMIGLALCAAFVEQSVCGAEPDRYWFLIHDRAVLAELKLTTAENASMHEKIDELDARFMELRGTTPEKVAAELPGLIAEAKSHLQEVLRPEQIRRLNEIVMRVQGPAALIRPDVAAQMKFTTDQKSKLDKIIGETQAAISALEKKGRDGEPVEPLQKEGMRLRTEEQSQVFNTLTKTQQALWLKLAGPPFDVSRLGKMAMKAPELKNSNVWINSQPLTLSQLKGRVVALHFYTFG